MNLPMLLTLPLCPRFHPSLLLKDIALSILPSPCSLFNFLLVTGLFPPVRKHPYFSILGRKTPLLAPNLPPSTHFSASVCFSASVSAYLSCSPILSPLTYVLSPTTLPKQLLSRTTNDLAKFNGQTLLST